MSTNITDGNFDGMLAEFILEKQNNKIISNEFGFIIYDVNTENNSAHITTCFIKKEYRDTAKIRDLMNKFIDEVCLKNNVETVTAVCELGLKNPELSLKSILKYKHKSGFKFNILPENKPVNFYMRLSNG